MPETTNNPTRSAEARRIEPGAEAASMSSPSYSARVAARIAVIMAERPPVTVDELGVIAGVLNCPASDLLPTRLTGTRSPSTPSVAVTTDSADLVYDKTAGDPFTTACPSWCVYDPHPVESCDEDRYHAGEITYLPLRSLTAESWTVGEGADGSHMLGHVQAYLMHRSLHAEPMVHADLNGSSVGIDVTLDEAEQLARLLLAMVEAAR